MLTATAVRPVPRSTETGEQLIYGGGCAIAQLPLRIVTPALQGTVVKDSARVESARDDAYGRPICTKVNRKRVSVGPQWSARCPTAHHHPNPNT